MQPQPITTLMAAIPHQRVSIDATLNPADLLTPEQAALVLGLSAKTLATWRSTGRHSLPFIRCGARIRYHRNDLAQWLNSRQRTIATDTTQGAA